MITKPRTPQCVGNPMILLLATILMTVSHGSVGAGDAGGALVKFWQLKFGQI